MSGERAATESHLNSQDDDAVHHDSELGAVHSLPSVVRSHGSGER